MDLILWRHAKAVDLRKGETDDPARALTPKGERRAARMAQWLNTLTLAAVPLRQSRKSS
jgi:phosphohistidine phosphatase